MVQNSKQKNNVSLVWKAFVAAYRLVGVWTTWNIGNGQSIKLGEDPWLGAGNKYKLPPPLVQALRECGLFLLSNPYTGSPQLRGHPGWKSTTSLDLPLDHKLEWETYIDQLCKNYVRLDESEGSPCWTKNPRDGSFTSKLGYKAWQESQT